MDPEDLTRQELIEHIHEMLADLSIAVQSMRPDDTHRARIEESIAEMREMGFLEETDDV
mgnify:FL=1